MTSETLDRGSVEGDTVVKCMLKFLDRDRNRLQHSENVGKPKSDKFHVVITTGLYYVLLIVTVEHVTIVSSTLFRTYFGECAGGISLFTEIASGGSS